MDTILQGVARGFIPGWGRRVFHTAFRRRWGIVLNDISKALDGLYPSHWAESWDNVGLTIGRHDAEIARMLVSLDVTRATIDEALALQCGLLLSHHPFPWRERRRFDLAEPDNALLAQILSGGLNLFAVHTNLDAAPDSHATHLALQLGLKNPEPLKPTGGSLVKIAVFVPEEAAGHVRKAMDTAGAGRLGNYGGCSYSSTGIGRFTPGLRAKPNMGAVLVENAVREEKVEVVCPEALQQRVLEAARNVHPYETMAWDVYPLAMKEPGVGLGRIGNLSSPELFAQLIARLKGIINTETLVIAGLPTQRIERVAICPGAAGDLIDRAIAAGAQLLIGAEFSHHEALHALANGLALIEAGHFATELPAVQMLGQACRDLFLGQGLEVTIAQNEQNPLAYF